MKKIILYGLFCLLSLSIFISCSKDIGNYEYHDINQITFTDFQTAGYQAVFGDTLRINPAVVMSKDQNPDEKNYIYEWSLRLASSSGLPLRDSVISRDKILKVKIGLIAGVYSLQYKITDKNTGVQFQKRANLTVTTDVYEGYMVLNDVGGQSRLDMLSYKATSNSFMQYTDVFKAMGVEFPQQGTPYQVLCMYYNQNYGIFQLTASGTNRINPETFAWDPTYNIDHLILGTIPDNFAPERLTGTYTSSNKTPVLCMYANNNMYTYTGAVFNLSAPVNVYSVGEIPFKVSPYVATDGKTALMYNMDKKNFVSMANYTSLSVTDAASSLKYPSGLDLMYMECIHYPEAGQVNTTYAVLKDPATSKCYLLRFVLGAANDYYVEINGTDIANAANFAFSPDLGYMFYNVGGKIYEYDLASETGKLMVDKGASKISFLSFLHFYDRYGKANYVEWSKWLNVGSYDPAGTPGKNGVLEQYSVPVVTGQIVQTKRWTGFGKIVSVAYRGR